MSDIAPPTISVLMSVFNGEAFLTEAVESIRDQTFSDFEFLIVDDGSVDGTAGILDFQASRDSRVRLLRQENRGLIAALNRGVSEARGRYIARMDADDVAMPDRLAKQVAYLDERPSVGVLGGAVLRIDSEGREFGVVPSITDSQAILSFLDDNSPIAHPTAMIRRELMDAIGAYRPAFLHAEDYDLWLRISERAEIANLSDVLLRYRVHSGNISRKYLYEKSTSVLLARASARARSRGGNDPADALDRFPDDFLQRFVQVGESRDWLEREGAPVLAARAAERGDLTAARRWLRITRTVRLKGQKRRMLVEHLVGQMRRKMAAGNIFLGCYFFYWAVRLRPTRAFKALVEWVRPGEK